MNRGLVWSIGQRLLVSIPILLGMVSVVFFIARLLPGDPFSLHMAPGIPAGTLEVLRHTYGLDRPLGEQYFVWLGNAVRGQFGISLTTNRPVLDLISETLPNTFLLGGTALLLQFSIGILAALACARRPGSAVDRLIGNSTVAIYSTPSFWLGTLLLYVFAFRANVLPPSQMHSVGFHSLTSGGYILDVLWHLVLPALTIAIPGAARVIRYLRGNLLQVLEEPFVTSARSHGLSGSRILWRYALPNALMPVITIGGMETGVLLTGALVTETLFAWPGIGRLTVSAVLARDYPLLLGTTIVSGCIVIAANLTADILHRVIDPRVRAD